MSMSPDPPQQSRHSHFRGHELHRHHGHHGHIHRTKADPKIFVDKWENRLHSLHAHREKVHSPPDDPPAELHADAPHVEAQLPSTSPGSSKQNLARTLVIWDISCDNLLALDFHSATSDPFCKVIIGKQIHRTKTLKKNLNPRWEAILPILLPPDAEWAAFELYDANIIGHPDPLGKSMFPIPKEEKVGYVEHAPLQRMAGMRKVQGTISFRYQLLYGDAQRDPTLIDAYVRKLAVEQERLKEREKGHHVLPNWLAPAVLQESLQPPADTVIPVHPKDPPTGWVIVKTLSASGLPGRSYRPWAGKNADPYCCIRLHSSRGTEELYTPVAENELNPHWGGQRKINIWEPDCRLEITVWHWSPLSDDPLGMITLPLGATSCRRNVHLPLKAVPGSDVKPEGSLVFMYEYQAPTLTLKQAVTSFVRYQSPGSFGRVVIRDLKFSNLAHFHEHRTLYTKITLSGHIGRQVKKTRCIKGEDEPLFIEFICFDIYERGLELKIELVESLGLMPPKRIGYCRAQVSDEDATEEVHGVLYSEKLESSTARGAACFTMIVIYASSHEFMSCFTPNAYSVVLKTLPNQRVPRANFSVLQTSSLKIMRLTVTPLQESYERLLELLSWRKPWLTLPTFVISFYVAYHSMLYQALAVCILLMFPRQWWMKDTIPPPTTRQEIQMQEAEEKRKRKIEHRQRKEAKHEKKKEALKRLKMQLDEQKHLQGLYLVEMGRKFRDEAVPVIFMPSDSSDEEEGNMDVGRAQMINNGAWYVYELSNMIEDMWAHISWQDPRQTMVVTKGVALWTISTFFIPFNIVLCAVVVYAFTLQSLYIRYPVLWQRFPPWRLSSFIPEAVQPHFFAEVTITILDASEIMAMDFPSGTSDPYVVVSLPRSGLRHSTSVKHNTLSPVWDEEMPPVYISQVGSRVIFEVWDYNYIPFASMGGTHNTSDFLGEAFVHIWGPEDELHITLPLRPRRATKEYVTGHLRIQMSVRMLTPEEKATVLQKQEQVRIQNAQHHLLRHNKKRRSG